MGDICKVTLTGVGSKVPLLEDFTAKQPRWAPLCLEVPGFIPPTPGSALPTSHLAAGISRWRGSAKG